METQGKFAGKIVLVTGGSRGIGYATAAAFLAEGARVAICALDGPRLAAALEELGKLGEVAGWQADVSDFPAMQDLVRRTLARFGRIAILVNNAGRLALADFSTQDTASIHAILDTNVRGTLNATRAVLPHLLENDAGCVVNIASALGTYGMPRAVVYCASKSAVIGFTAALALELRDTGVRVYGIAPGMTATDMQVQFSGYRQGLPPELVAEDILLLAGPNPPVRTGACLGADS